MRKTQREITLRPAVTLQGAAVKLRRLSVDLEDREPAKLLAGVLEAGALEAVREGGGASAVSHPHDCPANVGFRGWSGLSGSPLRMSAYSHKRKSGFLVSAPGQFP